MWQALAKIFGSGDVISSAIGLIDDMHTSDVERVEADTEAKTKIIYAKTKAKTDLMTAYAPFKIAQRYLAIMFSITFLACFVLVLVMTMLGKGDIAQVKLVISEFYIGEIMLAIIMFYFGGGLADSMKAKPK